MQYTLKTSLEDLELTRRLVDAGALLGIPVVDSIVIAANGRTHSIPLDA